MTENANTGRKFVDAAKGLVGEAGGRLAGDWIQYGYDQASGLSIGLLGKRIDVS